jgi:hypothetical protein
VLNSRLELHDIRDVEAFCTSIIRRRRLNIPVHDEEDLLAYLVETAWELSTTFQRTTVSFSTYAGNTLRARLSDWQRTRYGRTRWTFSTHVYERKLPELVSTDTELGAALLDRTMDGPADSAAPLLRLLAQGDSSPPPDLDRTRQPAARRAA